MYSTQKVESRHKQCPKLQGPQELLHLRGRPGAHREQEAVGREGVQGGAQPAHRASSQ